MHLPSFEVADVAAYHEEAHRTRLINSVVPEPTEIAIDPAELQAFCQNLRTSQFSRRRFFTSQPVNVVEGFSFSISPNEGYDAIRTGITSVGQDDALELARLILPIDEHYRMWSNTPDEITTKPNINMYSGIFSGKHKSDTVRHFDFGGAYPQVNYKLYFEGAPEHASQYNPGLYRLESILHEFGLVFDDLMPCEVITPTFNPDRSTPHLMPAGIVCVEPWNANHSGPRDKSARGTRRGILSVSYALKQKPQTHKRLDAAA